MKGYYIFGILLVCNVVYCLKGDFRSICPKHERKQEIMHIGPNETRTVISYISVDKCCTGYTEIIDTCIPQCDPPCLHGTCTEPNKCTCFENYFGDLCKIKKCNPGYMGSNCDEPCSNNTYGQDCRDTCDCKNGDCDPVSGKCECSKGWIGSSCDIECDCLNDDHYNASNGKCECEIAHTNIYLEPTCEPTFWGFDCKNKCQCGGEICNKTNGECLSSCNFGFYGENCDKTCTCTREGSMGCLRDTGKCICNLGWSGIMCEKLRKCPFLKFGTSCNNNCLCVKDHTETCDQMTGQCKCKAIWYGEICTKCLCEHGECNSADRCTCAPGWAGELCNKKCLEGYVGWNCEYKLDDCENRQFNYTSNQCVRSTPTTEKKESSVVMYQILLVIAGGIIAFVIILIAVTCWRDNNRKKRYIRASRQSSRNTNDAQTTSEEMSSPPTPLYEEIPFNAENPYNQLLHLEVEPDYLIPNDLSSPDNRNNSLYTSSSNDNVYQIQPHKFVSPFHSILNDNSNYDRVRYFPNNRPPRGETEILTMNEMPPHEEMYTIQSNPMDDGIITRTPLHSKETPTGKVFRRTEPFILQVELEGNRPRYTPPPSKQIRNLRKTYY